MDVGLQERDSSIGEVLFRFFSSRQALCRENSATSAIFSFSITLLLPGLGKPPIIFWHLNGRDVRRQRKRPRMQTRLRIKRLPRETSPDFRIRFWTPLLFLLILLAFPTELLAQTTTTVVLGTVRDSSGAPIAGRSMSRPIWPKRRVAEAGPTGW